MVGDNFFATDLFTLGPIFSVGTFSIDDVGMQKSLQVRMKDSFSAIEIFLVGLDFETRSSSD